MGLVKYKQAFDGPMVSKFVILALTVTFVWVPVSHVAILGPAKVSLAPCVTLLALVGNFI